MRYVSVRWLSLEKAVYRILQLYNPPVSYFKSEEESQAQFHRLCTIFENLMAEVYLLLYESILPTFTNINLLFQREDPSLYLVSDAIRSFLRKLLSKFLTIESIRSADDITTVEYENAANHLDNHAITIGLVTRQRLNKLFDEGDISDRDKKCFYKGIKAFYLTAVSQALQKLPFSDPVLVNSRFVNFERRSECTFDSVEFFCAKYANIFNYNSSKMDKLQEEFVDYQLLDRTDIPEAVWEESVVYEEEEGQEEKKQYHRMDNIWTYLSLVQNSADSSCRFPLLSRLARLVLIIPHSNAGEERVFSLIKQNKTPTRSSLNNDGTLASLIQIKLGNQETCIEWEPPKELLKSAKGATKQYNASHRKS